MGRGAPGPWKVLEFSDRGSGGAWTVKRPCSRGVAWEPYPGAIVEIEDHPRQDVVHPREDVRLGPDRHLTVGEEDGAAGPLPLQVLRILTTAGADMEC